MKKGIMLCALLALLSGNIFATQFQFNEPYRVNSGDVLHVFVWNEEELTREVLVQPDGKFSFPMVGEIQAGGQTTTDIMAAVTTGLEKYLRDKPVVTVSIVSINGNKIYVIGKVARPGEFVVSRNVDVMQALALAGGLNSYAAQDEVQILRRDSSGAEVAIPFEYQRVKEGKDLKSNIFLKSGDIVVVP